MTFVLVTTILGMLIFFLILPIGITVSDKPELGHADSAPKEHWLKTKIILSLIIGMILSGIYCYYLHNHPTLLYEIFG